LSAADAAALEREFEAQRAEDLKAEAQARMAGLGNLSRATLSAPVTAPPAEARRLKRRYPAAKYRVRCFHPKPGYWYWRGEATDAATAKVSAAAYFEAQFGFKPTQVADAVWVDLADATYTTSPPRVLREAASPNVTWTLVRDR
jgi:hypothetical protein